MWTNWGGYSLCLLHFTSAFWLGWIPDSVVPCAFSSFSISLPLLWLLYFLSVFSRQAFTETPACPPRVSPLCHWSAIPHVCSHALFPDLFMLSLLFLILALHVFLCPLSFPVPPLIHLYSSFLASFLEGKWEVINHDIMLFKNNHDLLSRLLGWNGHSKHNDERIKFLYYLIFPNNLT